MKKRGKRERKIIKRENSGKNKIVSLIKLMLVINIILLILLFVRVSLTAKAITTKGEKSCESCNSFINSLINPCNEKKCLAINKNCYYSEKKCVTGCNADANCDNATSSYELQQYIKKWQTGYITNKELMNAIKKSKTQD